MRKTLEKIGIILYIIGLFSFPVYKAFIENTDKMDNFTSICVAVILFFVYLIGWWFLFTPFAWLISSLFWPDKTGEEARGCFIFHFVLFIVIPLFIILPDITCNNRKETQRGADGKILKNGQYYDSQKEETGKVCISPFAFFLQVSIIIID